MGDHTGLRHQSPTGTSRRALGRTSANPIQTRVIGPGPHPGRCKPLLPVTLNSTPTTTHSQATQFLATPLPPISRCPPFHSPVLPNRRRHRTSLAQLQLLDVCHLSCGSGRLKALLARLGLDSPASDFSSQLAPSAVYLRFTSHPKWQTFFYVGATRTSLMARDHSRFRKLLQVQRHYLVNAELADRWWAHFDVFHFYTSVPIHIAVPATDLFAIEQFYIQELQPSLNFGFIERHFRPRTGFIRQLDFSQSRHMGFATIWRKRRRLRLPNALQQAFLAKRMSNRLDLWRLVGDLGSNTLRRFDAIRYIRSRDFPHAAPLYILHRIATHLPEPHHQACISAIRSSLRFRGLIPPGPSRPMLAPFFAHSSFRTLLLTQLRGFVRSTTRSALPFHVAQPRIVFKAHRKLSSALFSHLQAAQTWSLGELSCTCTDLAKRHPSLPKHEGHLLFFGSDTHELFDPDIVSMLSGSMRNSFFPPRGVLMNRLTQAFHHWARTNNLASLDPSTLSTIVDFHFDLHLPHTQQYFLHAHVQQALTTLEPLVRHCEDHADSRLMLYCPPSIEIHQRQRESIVSRFRGRYPWAVTGFGRPATAYILPKRKKLDHCSTHHQLRWRLLPTHA